MTTIVVQPPPMPTTVVQPPPMPTVVVNPVINGGGGGGGGESPSVYHVTTISSWNQIHSYPYLPSVRLIDSGGNAVDIAVEYPDSTHVTISFPVPFTGTIILS